MILEKANEAVKADNNKKFKLVVKETSLDLEDSVTYLKTVRHDKMDQFKEMIEKLGIDGISTPSEYMAYMNSIPVEEYEEITELGDDDDEEST